LFECVGSIADWHRIRWLDSEYSHNVSPLIVPLYREEEEHMEPIISWAETPQPYRTSGNRVEITIRLITKHFV